MPQYKLTCPRSECGEKIRKLLSVETFRSGFPCPKCQTVMEREGNVTQAKMETLDNGIMTKSVTRIADVEEAMHERGKGGQEKKWTHDR